MSQDIRISVEFLDHPKTIKLERRLGGDGLKSLLWLWFWCRVNKPCGILEGMDEEDIEIAARWNGERGTFVKGLLALRWMDVNESSNGVTYSLHDWDQHNAWSASEEERSNAARFSRMAKTHPEIHKTMREEGRVGITFKEYQDVKKTNAVKRPLSDSSTVVDASLTPAPAPAPSPAHNADNESSLPLDGDQPAKKEKIPFSEIVGFLNEKAGSSFKANNKTTMGHIKARWNEGFRLEDFKAVIEFKCAEWLTDEKFVQFLRPQTLFAGKFEAYLQAARVGGGRPTGNQNKCERCAYNQRSRCKNLDKPNFDPTKCNAFVAGT